MALTPEQIYGLRVRSGMDAFRPMKEHWQAKDDDAVYRFARAIKDEVRKQDEALIRQLVEALDDLVEAGEEAWSECRPCVRIGKKAATAGRAWLKGKP